MAVKGKRVYIYKGLQQGAFGTVVCADNDSFMLLTDDGERVYDRFENMVRAKEIEK